MEFRGFDALPAKANHRREASLARGEGLATSPYRGSEGLTLVLKGGAAMRVLMQSARYTQDLDL